MAKKSSKASIPARLPNTVQKILADAQALDIRRQHQINNQIGAINRFLEAWKSEAAWKYDDEMGELHKLLAAEQARAAELENQLRELEEGDIVGKRKDAFYAGFAAGETEDSVDESWAEYKEEQDTTDGDAAEGSSDDE